MFQHSRHRRDRVDKRANRLMVWEPEHRHLHIIVQLSISYPRQAIKLFFCTLASILVALIMVTVPTCRKCSMPAQPRHELEGEFHAHCCYPCKRTRGRTHASDCSYYLASNAISTRKRCTSSNESESQSWKKSAATPGGFSGTDKIKASSSNHYMPNADSQVDVESLADVGAKIHRSAKGCPGHDFQFSLLQHFVLMHCGSAELKYEWTALFREYTDVGRTLTERPLVDVLVVFPVHMESEVKMDHPGIVTIDARSCDCHSIKKVSFGKEIFPEGGTSTRLQAWMLKQRTTITLLRRAMELTRQCVRELGFYCEDATHNSVAIGLLFQLLFAPSVPLFSYRELRLL